MTLEREVVGGREVSVWMPPVAPAAVVFAGDGQLVAPWGADLATPVLVVGVHRVADEEVRLHEYSPGFEPAVFAAHEEVVLAAVERFGGGLPPERTAFLGVSAGGELALAMGERHPELFGAVLCASPGAGYRPPAEPVITRAYFVAGDREPFFRANAQRWADALAGRDVVLEVREGGHGDPFWRAELPRMVEWLQR